MAYYDNEQGIILNQEEQDTLNGKKRFNVDNLMNWIQYGSDKSKWPRKVVVKEPFKKIT